MTVSTGQAEYLLHPGSHHQKTVLPDDILQTVDAAVLETGVQSLDTVTLDDLRDRRQYAALVDAMTAASTPIFLVDPAVDDTATTYLAEAGAKLGLPAFLGIAAAAHIHPFTSLLALPGLSLSIGHRGGTAARLASYLQVSTAHTSFGLRSAATAAKLEQFVAPQLQDDGTERPTILLDVGAGHCDIRTYLQRPRLRRAVIRFHERRGFTGVNRDDVDRVCQFTSADGTPQKELHTITL